MDGSILENLIRDYGDCREQSGRAHRNGDLFESNRLGVQADNLLEKILREVERKHSEGQ